MHFLTLRRSRPLLLGLAAAGIAPAVAAPSAALASSDASPVVGRVYVNDNTAETNRIGAFDRHADGTLPLKSGPRLPQAGPGPERGWHRRARCRSRRTAGS